MLFKRYWNQIYKQGYEPCEKRAFTRKTAQRREPVELDKGKAQLKVQEQRNDKLSEFKNVMDYYKNYCHLFDTIMMPNKAHA